DFFAVDSDLGRGSGLVFGSATKVVFQRRRRCSSSVRVVHDLSSELVLDVFYPNGGSLDSLWIHIVVVVVAQILVHRWLLGLQCLDI
ncbi:hypothetical protein A2U01_0057254, partial [Trifolium medium]|nr:hypothetical protein [Trifolium medium]